MEQFDFIAKLLGIKDQNIKMVDYLSLAIHKEIRGRLDSCPDYKAQMGKYDFQKTSKIPYLKTAGYKILIRLRKRRFRCKDCVEMAVAETSLIRLPLQ